MDEVWKDIEGYEGLYQVSNTGEVKSLNYRGNGESKLLKQGTNKKGYKIVSLFKNGKGKSHRVHRLVAMTFILNPNNYREVNHKDENKYNNNVDNLEWCNAKYNNNYGTRNKRASESLKGKHHSGETKKKISKKMKGENNPNYGKKGKDSPNSKPILMYDREGDFIKRFDSIGDANEHFGKARGCSVITSCLRGRNKTAYGFIFIYADDNQDTLRKKINEANDNKSGEAHKKPILMLDKEGNFIRYFECVKDTDEFFGKKDASSAVSKCLKGRRKTAYGYVFKYANEDYYIRNKNK